MSSMASGHHHNHASFYIGNHHHRAAHSRPGQPLIEVDVIEEGLDYGSDRASMAHSLGHTARSSVNSASTGTIAFTGRSPHLHVAPHPVPAASAASTTSWRNALSRRRSSDGGMAIQQQPHLSATYPNFLAVPSTAAVGAGRRNSTPGTVVPLSGSSRDESCFRSTSYEEELELRLEHVRLRAVDAERRLAAERLKRRRAAQRIAELERQHVEKTNDLIAEADRRADKLRVRCEQVREECRRREAEAEKQCAEMSDKFQTRLRKIEEQLVEALRCQKVDSSKLCDASSQTNDSSIRSQSPSVATTKDTQDKLLLGKEKRQTLADDLDGRLTTFLAPTDNVWISLYDMVATLAFSRVRYLESLTLTENSSSRPTKRTGKYTQVPYPLRNGPRRAIRRRDVGGGDKPSAAPPSERHSSESLQTLPPSPTATPRLRRTSSCPSHEAAAVAAAASAASSSGVIRRQPSAPEASSGKTMKRYTIDFSIEKSASLTAVCDSQSVRRLHQERASGLEKEILGDEPNSASLKGETVGDLDACSPIASGQSSKRFNSSSDATAAAQVAEQPTAQTSSSASNKPKRLSSLNLEDIFRKLQTGVQVKGRRADKDRERVQGLLTASNGDSGNTDVAELARKSLSPRHRSTSLMSRSQSAGSDSLEKNSVQNSPTRCVPVRAVHGQLFARRSVGLDQEVDDSNNATENTSSTAQPEVEISARVEGNEFFDVESQPGDVSDMSGLRRSLPLSPRRRERTRRQASLLIEGDLLRHSTSVNLESGSANDETAQSGKAAAEVETVTSTPSRSAPRPISSFGRLQERRNGLTTLDDSHLIAKSSLGRPTTSHSRLDNIARNIKTYLTNHSQ